MRRGSITALLCGALFAGPLQATATTPTRYRFARPPTVVFVKGEASGRFWVFARLNRALPRNRAGVRATLQLDGGSAPYGKPVTSSKRPPCYSAEIDAVDNPKAPPSIVSPKDGETVTVTLRFPGRDGASVALAARGVSRRAVGSDATNARYLRQLGC